MKSSPRHLLLAAVALAAVGCWGGSETGVPAPYEGAVQGMWHLDYEPTEVVLSQAGRASAHGVLGAQPIDWKGSTVSFDCADSTLLCPEEVLGTGDGSWPVQEMDPSELLFPVAVQPNSCTEEERISAGGAACGAELLPVEQEELNVRLPEDGSTFFMPRSVVREERRVCYARTSVDLAFHDLTKPTQQGGRPQAQRVSGAVSVTIPAGCLRDDDARPLAPLGVEAELRMETRFSGTWSPRPPE